MKYIITTKKKEPFIKKWFDYDNYFKSDFIMIVYDLLTNKFTDDGKNQYNVEIDTF